MTDPTYPPTPTPAEDLTTPVEAPVTADGSLYDTPPAADATSTANPPTTLGTTPTTPGATPGAPSESLTPLYAAAGLAEVVMTTLRSRLSQAQAQAKGVPAGKGRIADLQQQLKTYRDRVTVGYNDLATRGKPTVDSTLVTVRHLSGRAERKVEDLVDPATPARAADPASVDDTPPVVVQPVVVVDATDTDGTPGAAR
jgi:hypothetical protein